MMWALLHAWRRSVPGAHELGTLVLFAAAYFIAARIGLSLASVHESATAVWPPTGIAIAGLVILGPRFWPAVAVGAFGVNLTVAGAPVSSLGIAIGNTFEALVAVSLLRRVAGGDSALERPGSAVAFALIAAFAATVSATVGVASLLLDGHAQRAQAQAIWLTWWLGDAAGALVFAPVLMAWLGRSRPPVSALAGRGPEATLLALASVLSALAVFGGVLGVSVEHLPVGFLVFPPLIWSAYRFGPRGAASAVLVVTVLAIWGTLRGFGPFAREDLGLSLLLLQSFVAVTAVMTGVLAAAVLDQERSEERARRADERSRLTEARRAQVLDEFLATAAHELRTPITSLRMAAQMLQRDDRPERRSLVARTIEQQSVRLNNLISRLLDSVRVDADRLAIDAEPSDLAALVRGSVDQLRPAAGERHFELRLEPVRASVDPLRVEQILTNLLDNAIRYTPAAGTIEVDLERRDGLARVRVRDGGSGVPESLRPHLFERFSRGEPTRGASGLGLGLYVSRELARLHGGGLELEESGGVGACFTLTLPCASETADERT